MYAIFAQNAPEKVKMQRLVSKAEGCGGTRQEWLDCLREIVEVGAETGIS